MEYDVFISYSSKDKMIADQICEAAENAGLICWMAPRNVTPGKKYAAEIVEAIRNSSVMLMIFSESSNKSEHVENEIDIAFNEGKTIVPFRITDTEMSNELKYYLGKKHWVDGTPEPEKYFEKLVEQISLSVPRRSKEMQEEEVFNSIDRILEEFRKKGSDIPDSKLRSLREKLDDFIASELSDTDGLKETADRPEENENSDGRYDIFQNDKGEIMIITKHKPGAPEKPRLVYDGGAYALLYRSRDSSIMLNNINPEARPMITAVDEVLIVEIKDDEVCREYMAPVRNVRSLDQLLK
ncbi:MAG: toll/interleukin-1 receptor domain-containing protein [Prevotellaceae bacterium]|jgi:hypothetical protein|nr:toll/interleukin-1 receptor domain-containing protein [Prevotellaceae bacterium]